MLAGPSLVYGQCCQTKVVTGMADPNLDDTYTLAPNPVATIEPVCIDGCVYTRDNPGSTGDEYCFKNEQSNGAVQCQAGTTVSLQSLETQKSGLENDVRQLENEVQALEVDETTAEELNTELDKVDDKIEELTSDGTTVGSGRVQRQAPTNCDEIADIIEALADQSKTNAERLALVKRILQTTITKCKSKDKLTKTKVKIKIVKTETGVRIKLILKKKTKAKNDIVEKKKLIVKIQIQIGVITGSTPLPPLTDGPGGESSLKPTGEIGVSLKPTGEIGVSIKPTGEIAIPMNSTGEIAIPMNSTGEQAVSVKPTGEIGVSMKPPGEIAVAMNSTGQQAVEMKPTGQQAVEMTSGGSTMSAGQKAVPVTEDLGQFTAGQF